MILHDLKIVMPPIRKKNSNLAILVLTYINVA